MDSLLVTRMDGVVTVTLNRPERKNALRGEDWEGLGRIFREVADRPDDRVLVVTGAGAAFCAGADLGDPGRSEQAPLERMRQIALAARSIQELPKPSIAKVDGVAVGAGCNLALCCDLVVASDRARFSEIFALRGLSLDFGGSWLLPRLVGLQTAKRLALLAEILDASRARQLGLVAEVLPATELDAFVDGWARRLAAGPPIALSLTKALLDASWSSSFTQAVEAEAHAQVVNFATSDAREAMEAFRAKRTPVFEGR